jgi:cholesterol transport system auxiliary component
MSRLFFVVIAGLLLASCGGNVRNGEVIRYDFGTLASEPGGSPVQIAAVLVQATPWLTSSAMHFRLAYSEPLRRQSYAESRWAAAPGELLESFVKRRLVFGQVDFSASGCHLQLGLNELEQSFNDPQHATVVLEVHATLTPPQGPDVLSSKSFVIRKPAPAPTAGGGALATRDAVLTLTDDLRNWLANVARSRPAVAERCLSR